MAELQITQTSCEREMLREISFGVGNISSQHALFLATGTILIIADKAEYKNSFECCTPDNYQNGKRLVVLAEPVECRGGINREAKIAISGAININALSLQSGSAAIGENIIEGLENQGFVVRDQNDY